MKILITNTVTLNGGDAAILVAIERHLYEVFGPAVEISIHDSQPEIAEELYPDRSFHPITATFIERRLPRIKYLRGLLRLFSFWRFSCAARSSAKGSRLLPTFLLTKREREHLNKYLECDLLISTGGTYLVEHYNMRIRLLELEMLAAARKKWILYTQSLGPFHRTGSEFARIFDKSSAIFLRDERSRQNLEAIGMDLSKCHVCHDVVFGLHDPDGRTQAMPADRSRVAISVRHWKHFTSGSMDTYRDAIRGLVQHLVENRNARVTFLSTCQGVEDYQFDDAEVARKIVETLPPNVKQDVEVDGDYHHPLDLQRKLGEYDVVVATRMHMSILALNAQIPVVNIAYEFKSQELFESVDLGDWVLDIETLHSDLLIQKTDLALDDKDSLRKTLRELLPKLKSSADRPRDWLAAEAASLAPGSKSDQTCAEIETKSP